MLLRLLQRLRNLAGSILSTFNTTKTMTASSTSSSMCDFEALLSQARHAQSVIIQPLLPNGQHREWNREPGESSSRNDSKEALRSTNVQLWADTCLAAVRSGKGVVKVFGDKQITCYLIPSKHVNANCSISFQMTSAL